MKQTPIHVQDMLDIRQISVKHEVVIVTLVCCGNHLSQRTNDLTNE